MKRDDKILAIGVKHYERIEYVKLNGYLKETVSWTSD